MEYCCPSPENPVIVPNPDSLKHRRFMRYVMYGQFFMSFSKMLLFGFFSGLLQLISVWIAYNAWATMHFCNALMVMIFAGLDLLMLMLDFQRINTYLGNYIFIWQLMFYLMLVYLVVAMYLSYKAYKCFKEQHAQQNSMSNYQMFGGRNMSQYDSEANARSAGGRSNYLVSGPGVNRS
jgi:hypothetical protein